MIPSSRSVRVLTAWPFVTAALVLMLNDLVFKYSYPGWITGKLSDFAGLFVVAGLVLMVRPQRYGLPLALVAALFAWWKSPASDGLIELVRGVGLPIGRVVDPGDLIAFVVLPLAPFVLRPWLGDSPTPSWKMPAAWASGTLVALALMGTSQIRPLEPTTLIAHLTTDGGSLDPEHVRSAVAVVMKANGFSACERCVPDSGKDEVIYQSGTHAYVRYVLLDGNRTVRFTIDKYSGYLGIHEELKRELARYYPKLEFEASEKRSPTALDR